MVANKFLEDIDMDDNMRLQCVSMCQHFHQVRRGSEGVMKGVGRGRGIERERERVRERERGIKGWKHLISCTHKLSLF